MSDHDEIVLLADDNDQHVYRKAILDVSRKVLSINLFLGVHQVHGRELRANQ